MRSREVSVRKGYSIALGGVRTSLGFGRAVFAFRAGDAVDLHLGPLLVFLLALGAEPLALGHRIKRWVEALQVVRVVALHAVTNVTSSATRRSPHSPHAARDATPHNAPSHTRAASLRCRCLGCRPHRARAPPCRADVEEGPRACRSVWQGRRSCSDRPQPWTVAVNFKTCPTQRFNLLEDLDAGEWLVLRGLRGALGFVQPQTKFTWK